MLSVVIATRDRAALLAGALDSLADQSGIAQFEVVVADNGSSDRTAEVVAERVDRFGGALQRVFVAEPNRGLARNRGVAASKGEIVVFVDDDVVLPEHFLAAHKREHRAAGPLTVAGPILNVPSPDVRPTPTLANASRAFFCTCNASLPRSAFDAVGGFDEAFNLYGWEDTDLGIRLRRSGVKRAFTWEAYLYHIKPPHTETLDVALQKTTEKARMAARLVAKDPSSRTRLATGAHVANVARAALVAPPWSLGWYENLARNERLPSGLRAFARAQMLDGTYVRELRRSLRDDR
jgi:glycosyltransferase involved in cell wall biosynthesis